MPKAVKTRARCLNVAAVTFLAEHEVTLCNLKQKVLTNPAFTQVLKILVDLHVKLQEVWCRFAITCDTVSSSGISVLHIC